MKYEFIGWCSEGSHDKVWGAIEIVAPEIFGEWPSTTHIDGKYCTFWGRRGKKLQTKIVEGDKWRIWALAELKRKKGYAEIEPDKLNEVYPEFEDDLKKTAFWATFKV